jgi:chemotaxis protein MotB
MLRIVRNFLKQVRFENIDEAADGGEAFNKVNEKQYGLVVVSLPSDTMFPVGKVGLTEAAREALFRMGGIIASIGNRIDVRGHTDPAITTDGSYASKWMLLLARTADVANELRNTDYGRQIPEFARFMLARRLDVLVHPHSGDI